jgi:hypothetical protein
MNESEEKCCSLIDFPAAYSKKREKKYSINCYAVNNMSIERYAYGLTLHKPHRGN